MKNIHFLTLSFVLAACTGKVKDQVMPSKSKSENLKELSETPILPSGLMSVKIKNYNPQAGHKLKDIFVSNYSAKLSQGNLHLSSARDSMSDELKGSLADSYGFGSASPQSRFNQSPSFSDLVLWLAGTKLTQQNLVYCAPSQRLSSSNDALIYDDERLGDRVFLGLRDCEKNYMGLNPKTFDFDNDGVPDYLELRCGMNPRNGNDASLSPSADGISNIEKCKLNIPIDESATAFQNKAFTYKYETQLLPNGSRNFTVSNIPILNDGEANFMAFYIVETNLSTNVDALFSAYSVVKGGSSDATLQFNYWSTAPGLFLNQELVSP